MSLGAYFAFSYSLGFLVASGASAIGEADLDGHVGPVEGVFMIWLVAANLWPFAVAFGAVWVTGQCMKWVYTKAYFRWKRYLFEKEHGRIVEAECRTVEQPTKLDYKVIP